MCSNYIFSQPSSPERRVYCRICEAYANGCSQEKDKSKELCLSTKQAKGYYKTTFLCDYFCNVKQAYMPIVVQICIFLYYDMLV